MQINPMNRKRSRGPVSHRTLRGGTFGLERIPRSALRFSWAIFDPSLREDLQLPMVQAAKGACLGNKDVHAIDLARMRSWSTTGTTTEGAMTMKMMHNPAGPGELLKEFLGDRTVTELAQHIGVARATISRIVNGRTAITMDLSIRLGEALSLSPDFFSKAQLQYDLWVEMQKRRRRIKPLAA